MRYEHAGRFELLATLEKLNRMMARLGGTPLIVADDAAALPLPNLRAVVAVEADHVTDVAKTVGELR